MPSNNTFASSVNELLGKLEDNPTIETGIELANQIISLFGEVNTKSVEDVFESSLELPSAERYDSWFQPHPIFKSDRACFDLADAPLLQAKFYWLKKRSRQILAGGVHFTPNYEDEEFTHNERYKVGLDFFLSPNGKSLQVVLSNRGNLRIVELSGRLNNTQKEIFEKWLGAGSLKSQDALHTTLWESFKLKSVNQKFYDGVSNSFTELLQHLKSIDKDEEEAKLFASRLLGRLLFCWFLRKKGIIDESVGYFNAQGVDATSYYKQSLERLFFLTLNTPIDDRDELTKQHQKALFPELLIDDQPSLFKTDQKTPYLNGGLFEPHENDWHKDDSLTLPEGFFTNLYDHFEEFNFTTDESSPEYEQIAIDPEMLGRVFESLLATQVDETGQQARKAKGAFYTPREIVSYMCKESLRNYLYNAVNNDESTKESIDSLLDISDSEWAKSKSNTLRDKVKDNRTQIFDALDAVTILDPACGSGAYPMGMLQLMLKTYERLESRFDPYKTKLSVIQNNIFGVDIEPMAVEISRLRAWLSLIVDEDDPRSVDPLPNLDFKFVCANSLVPLDKEMGLFSDSTLHQKLKDIRTKYFNARKKHTKKALQDEYYKLTSSEQTSLITDDNRTKQLKSFDPFKNSTPAHFYDNDHMFGLERFDVIIGNPPYGAKFTSNEKAYLKSLYNTVHVRTPDSFNYFIGLAFRNTKPNGVISYITSNNLLYQNEYIKTRRIILEEKTPKRIVNLGDNIFDSAIVPSCVFVLVNQKQLGVDSYGYFDLRSIPSEQRQNILPENYAFCDTSIDETLLSPSSVFGIDSEGLKIIDQLKSSSVTIDNIAVEVASGISTGGDKIFRLSVEQCESLGIEAELLKPVLVGREVHRYHYDKTGYKVIYMKRNVKIDDFPNALSYLADHKEKLSKRSETKSGILPWYSLNRQRTEKLFDEPKILLRQTSDNVTAVYEKEGFYAIDSLLVLKLTDPSEKNYLFMEGYLNSSLCNYLYKLISQEAGRIFAQVKPKNIRKIPVPTDEKIKEEIAEISSTIRKDMLDKSSVAKNRKKIDELLYSYFELSENQQSVIEEAIK
jgi:type I restriction-modification system DNA methylase subunit